jgi:phage terminase small subunit
MTSKARLARIDIFAKAIVEGKTQAEAYRLAYPTSTKWRADHVHTKAYEMAKDEHVLSRIEELRKEVTKEFVWERVMSLKVLAKVATDKTSKDSDKVAAVKVLNAMYGYDAPQKAVIDHTSSDGTMTPRPTIDMTKLSDSALEEIMNAKI